MPKGTIRVSLGRVEPALTVSLRGCIVRTGKGIRAFAVRSPGGAARGNRKDACGPSEGVQVRAVQGQAVTILELRVHPERR